MTDTAQNNAVALRTRLKQLRDAQDPTDRNRGGLLIRGRLFTWLATNRTRMLEEGRAQPSTIAAFWSTADEPPLQPLLHQWVEEHGLSVTLPVVDKPDAPLTFRQWSPEQTLQTGPYGIQEPTDGDEAPPPDIVLVPTLGFTRQGDRVGYGKGYYDRTLAALKAQGHQFTTIGIAWACGDLSGQHYTPAPHDLRLDSILTDKGWAVPAPVL